MCVCVCLCVGMCTLVQVIAEAKKKSLIPQITSSYELPNVGAENRTQVLCKNSMCS